MTKLLIKRNSKKVLKFRQISSSQSKFFKESLLKKKRKDSKVESSRFLKQRKLGYAVLKWMNRVVRVAAFWIWITLWPPNVPDPKFSNPLNTHKLIQYSKDSLLGFSKRNWTIRLIKVNMLVYWMNILPVPRQECKENWRCLKINF